MFINYTYTGADGEIIPRNATHVSIHESLKVIPNESLSQHPNMIELILHANVEKIGSITFHNCPRLKRVIMLGVRIIERCLNYDFSTPGGAFYSCEALTHVECPKLEIIGHRAFYRCKSLYSINLTAVRIVGEFAFDDCKALTHAKFGSNLELLSMYSFVRCTSLERITIPLKNNLMQDDFVFNRCDNLKHVHLIEETKLRQCFDALLLVRWRNDMSNEMDSIEYKLSNVPADSHLQSKTSVIKEWIENVLRKFRRYKKLHVKSLDEASVALQHAGIPEDIVTKGVLQYLDLPHVPVLEEASRKRRRRR